MRMTLIAFLTLATGLSGALPAAASCTGIAPSIAGVHLTGSTMNGTVNVYHFSGRVTNIGSKAEPSNTLQFIDIYEEGVRKDDRGIPPLRPGQSYTFGYDYQRSTDAGAGTSHLRFQLRMRQPAMAMCSNSRMSYDINF